MIKTATSSKEPKKESIIFSFEREEKSNKLRAMEIKMVLAELKLVKIQLGSIKMGKSG